MKAILYTTIKIKGITYNPIEKDKKSDFSHYRYNIENHTIIISIDNNMNDSASVYITKDNITLTDWSSAKNIFNFNDVKADLALCYNEIEETIENLIK